MNRDTSIRVRFIREDNSEINTILLDIGGDRFYLSEDDTSRLQQRLTEVLSKAKYER